MRNTLKLLLTALLLLSLLLSAALADEVVISEREKAIRAADRAMEEKYGITLLAQEYFDRTAEEKEGGYFIIEYKGAVDWAYVLGTYKVIVKDGEATEISWSHDGEDTSGLLQADAWGMEQILEMLRLNQQTGDISLFMGRIDEINRQHGLSFPPEILSDEEQEARRLQEEADSEEIRKMAKFPAEDLDDIAEQAIIAVFGLDEDQAVNLENLTDPEEEDYWYEYLYGIPCYRSNFGLDNEDEPDDDYRGISYTDKEGAYWVYVNVLTGVVEEIMYTAGIGGNG